MGDFEREEIVVPDKDIQSVGEAEKVIDKVLSTGRDFYNGTGNVDDYGQATGANGMPNGNASRRYSKVFLRLVNKNLPLLIILMYIV